MRHRGSVLVFPERTVAWAPSTAADMAAAMFAPLTDPTADTALLLVGLGNEGGPLAPAVRTFLKSAGIAVEAMTTAAACRTYNVLLSEERRVAAALLAID